MDEQRGRMSRQGAVVIQCVFDANETLNRGRQSNMVAGNNANTHLIQHPVGAAQSDAVYRIDIFDLVYSVDAHRKPSTTYGGFYASSVPIMSALNGIYRISEQGKNMLDNTVASQKESVRSMLLSERIRFVGVALTEANPNNVTSPNLSQEQVTVMVRGTVSVMNTGLSHFRVGETVMWKIPTADDYVRMKKNMQRSGRSIDKMPFMLVPRRAAMEDVPDTLGNLIANNNVDIDKNKQPAIIRFCKHLRMFLLKLALGLETPITTSADYSSAGLFGTSMMNTLTGPQKDKLAEVDALIKASRNTLIKELVSAFMELDADIQRRTVGTALSFSEPWSALDLYVKGG